MPAPSLRSTFVVQESRDESVDDVLRHLGLDDPKLTADDRSGIGSALRFGPARELARMVTLADEWQHQFDQRSAGARRLPKGDVPNIARRLFPTSMAPGLLRGIGFQGEHSPRSRTPVGGTIDLRLPRRSASSWTDDLEHARMYARTRLSDGVSMIVRIEDPGDAIILWAPVSKRPPWLTALWRAHLTSRYPGERAGGEEEYILLASRIGLEVLERDSSDDPTPALRKSRAAGNDPETDAPYGNLRTRPWPRMDRDRRRSASKPRVA